MGASAGIGGRLVSETPISIIDLETTGLSEGIDKIVELAVVRCEPGKSPELVLDTLVNPRRAVAATEIHGISDSDVANAPLFSEIAHDVADALADSVVCAYNVYFDIRFLRSELQYSGVHSDPPHFCLMYMRPLLGMGPRCRLSVACEEHGIDFGDRHMAAADALAEAELWQLYLRRMKEEKVRTFDDIARRKSYKFTQSFGLAPPSRTGPGSAFGKARLKSRFSGVADKSVRTSEGDGTLEYFEQLKLALSDWTLTPGEIESLREIRTKNGIPPEKTRALHCHIFAWALNQYNADRQISEHEAVNLKKLHSMLLELGYAPGA